MAKQRELTEIEKFYIENNLDKNDNEVSANMTGVGPKTVAKYRESIPTQKQTKDTDHTTETTKERIDRLGNGAKSGEFISRRDGVAIMTQESSEISDARKIVQGEPISSKEFQEINKDKIHRPQS
tara:strand:+ start:2751 stop:3125 length:375 start_codon:yes stop_codon:yes gene_type:complete